MILPLNNGKNAEVFWLFRDWSLITGRWGGGGLQKGRGAGEVLSLQKGGGGDLV